MRTKAEVKLLKVKQNLTEVLRALQEPIVVDLDKYKLIQAKLNAVNYYLLKIRKREVRIKKSAL